MPLLLALGLALAEAPCLPRSEALAVLSRRFQEVPVGAGLDQAGNLVELLRAPSGSWTLLLTRPGGPACAVAAGQGWDSAPPVPPGRAS